MTVELKLEPVVKDRLKWNERGVSAVGLRLNESRLEVEVWLASVALYT